MSIGAHFVRSSLRDVVLSCAFRAQKKEFVLNLEF